MKHVIWDNDVCEMFDSVKDNLEDCFPEMDPEDMEDISDEDIWNRAYEEIEVNFEAEQSNLNVETKGEIILTGNLERWDGSRYVYKELKTKNIGKALVEAINSFDGDNQFEIYVQDGNMCISQLGHDNPTNPSIMQFREMTKGLDELWDESADVIVANSVPMGHYACKVYGWDVAAA